MRDAIRNQCERVEELLLMINVKDTIEWTPAIVKGLRDFISSYLKEEQTKMEKTINSVRTLDGDTALHVLTEPSLADCLKTNPMPPAGSTPLPPPTAPTSAPSRYIRIPNQTPTGV